MADDIIVEQNQPADIQAELATQMAISLNGGMVPEAVVQAQAAVQTVVETAADPFGIFKEKFGYETPEAAITEIESLRAFKAAPPAQPYKFENAESEALAKAINAGNLSEVHSILDRRIRIDSLTEGDMTPEKAADVVKLGMQIKYKDLSSKEIDYKFNKTFAVPPKPVQTSDEELEDYQQRLSAWQSVADDRNMELMIEAKLAKPELQTAKTKLVFPEIGQTVDEDYVQWKKAVEDNGRLAEQTALAYKTFTPKTIETKINFNDEANKIAFEFQYEPDAKGFSDSQEMAADITKFWKQFINSDGNPNREKFLKAVHFMSHQDEIILAAITQAKNATIKASLPDNSTGGLVRQLPQDQGEVSELDKQMRASLKGYGGF